MKAHVITNGKVVNTVEVESLDSLPNLVAATEGEIGWLYENGALINPNPKSQTEIDRQVAEGIRMTRNKKLADSDWTQFALDNNLTSEIKEQWTIYRQALRNIPQQPGFPHNITWPVEPSS